MGFGSTAQPKTGSVDRGFSTEAATITASYDLDRFDAGSLASLASNASQLQLLSIDDGSRNDAGGSSKASSSFSLSESPFASLASMASVVYTTGSTVVAKAAASAGLTINLMWDASVNSAPASFKTAVQAAASMIQQYVSTPITINIAVGWGEIGGFSGSTYQQNVPSYSALGMTLSNVWQSYSSLTQSLTNTATSADDRSVLSALPSSNPFGTAYFDLAGAQAKALGLTSGTSTQIDGAVGFATNWPSTDYIAAALHEITHAMGRNSGWGGTNYDTTLLDLTRFSAPGVFVTDGSTAVSSALQYFSFDGGKTALAYYDNTSDYGDFATTSQTLNDPNNAYVGSNSNALTALDIRTLDVMGFTLAGSSPTPAAPDLVVSSLSSNATTVTQGNILSYAYVVANNGTGSASNSVASIALDGTVLTSAQVAALSAGGSNSLSGTLSTNGLSTGTHVLTITADATGLISESSETNNATSLSFTVVAPTAADLIVNSLSTSAASVTQGGSLSYSYAIKDIGTGSAGLSQAKISLDGVTLSTASVSALLAGSSFSSSGTINTAGLAAGSHVLTVTADSGNQVSETNEGNNAASVNFTVLAASSPDLTVSALTAASSSVSKGTSLSYSFSIKDIGTGPAASNLASVAIDGTVVSTVTIGTLSSGGTFSTSSVINTSGLSVGSHVLTVKADSSNLVAESNESNNSATYSFNVTQLAMADLTVSGFSVPASVNQGSNLSYSFSVNDSGTLSAGPSKTNLYLDGTLLSTRTTGRLAVGSSSLVMGSFSTGSLSTGQHTLTVVADAASQVAESNETNNSSTLTFTVNPVAATRADLVIAGLTPIYGSSVIQGDVFAFYYSMDNNGSSMAGASKAAYQIDSTPSSGNYYGYNSFGSVYANSTGNSVIDYIDTSSLSVGTHTLYVKADAGGAVSEADESNNVSSFTFTVLGRPDYLVSGLSMNSTVAAGGKFTLNYTVSNQGNSQPWANSYAMIYFDGNANSANYDVIRNLGTNSSQNFSDTFSIGAGVSKGMHTVTIIADGLDYIPESLENNNSRTFSFRVV